MSHRFQFVIAFLSALACALLSAAEPAASTDGRTLVVGHKVDGSVCWYDAATGARQARTEVGYRPHELAISHDRKWCYVTLYGLDLYTEDVEGGKAVAIVDLAKREKVGEIELGEYRRPHGIEIGHTSGLLYVTTDRPAALLVLDPKERKVVKAVRLSDHQSLPHMCIITPDEKTAFVACCGNSSVHRVDLTEGKDVQQIPIGGVPMGMALTADAKILFAVNRTADGVAVIDVASRKVERIIPIPGNPVRCHLTPDGKRLLVTLIVAGECAVVDVAKLEPTHRVKIGNRVEGLTVDPAGRFAYASAQADHKIIKFSLGDDPQPVLTIDAPGRPDPLGVLP